MDPDQHSECGSRRENESGSMRNRIYRAKAMIIKMNNSKWIQQVEKKINSKENDYQWIIYLFTTPAGPNCCSSSSRRLPPSCRSAGGLSGRSTRAATPTLWLSGAADTCGCQSRQWAGSYPHGEQSCSLWNYWKAASAVSWCFHLNGRDNELDIDNQSQHIM